MIAAVRRFFAARVGRRLFLLFILSAFIPLATLALLSYQQLRDIMLQQGEQRLAATAKGFGMTLFERLLVDSDLAATSVGTQVPGEGSLARRNFTSLARVRPDGSVVPVFGDSLAGVLDEAARARLAEGKPVLVTWRSASGARLFLAVPATVGGEAVALAELAQDTFWQPELVPAATEFCVVDEDRRDILFCTAPMPASLLAAPVATSAMRAQRWVRDGEARRAVIWPQYMRQGFGTSDWIVVASQPESHQLAKLIEYQQIYVPVVLLALLLVSWLTIRQSRSVVEPVRQLAAHARGITGKDFTNRVRMDREDEFGALAGAFNQMSERLGRQFAALNALAEIDQMILSTLDTAQVVRTVLERMGNVVPANFIGMTLFDPENRNLAHAYFRDMQLNDGVVYSRVDLQPQDREVLQGKPAGAWMAIDESATGLLATLHARGVRMAYVQPIIWREELCGALALGYHQETAGTDEERQQAREFADRIAVAVSSAWRDEQLYLQAHFDLLTGLPNRLLFKDRLGQEIARCQREQRHFAVLFIDIDRFKNVNDTLGHSAGDSVLCEAARRITACVRESDTVSRLGGDEFTVIVTNIARAQDAGTVADQIVRELSRAFVVDGQHTFLSASVGVAAFPGDGKTPDEILRNADTAMYRAKAAGRALVVYFEERMNAEAVARLTLDRDLREALERGDLSVHYQPLLTLATGEVRGAEALLRWRHPERGNVPPSRFIPLAEETGFIEQLGRFALEQACVQARAWRDAGLPVQRVSVNVSPRQLRKPGVVAMFADCAREAGIGLEAIQVEITEGLLIDHADTVEGLLRELDAAGATIALDDFGTGFSSMAYLNRFPIHVIKIDRVFIDGIGRGRGSEAIVQAIVAMSHALGKTVVAEGVETAAQLTFLQALGCDEIQGYYVARPMPAAEFAQFVRARALAPDTAAAPK